jgi:nitroreductase
MDAIEAIMTRRSVRRFTPQPVSDAEIEVVLRAAMAAPSAGNERPWRFVVVTEPEMLARLAKATPFAGALASAAVGIVVCADRSSLKYPGFWPVDCAAATENALLAANALGLGGVWMGVHPIAPLMWNVRRIVGVPRGVEPMSLVALGHPATEREPVDRWEPAWVRWQRWDDKKPDQGEDAGRHDTKAEDDHA